MNNNSTDLSKGEQGRVATIEPSSPPFSTQPGLTVEGLKFFDYFESNDLDTTKWQKPSMPNHIYQSNGALNFEVGLSQPGSDVYTSIVPKYSGQPIHRIDFTVRVPQFNAAGKGGVDLVLNPVASGLNELSSGRVTVGRRSTPYSAKGLVVKPRTTRPSPRELSNRSRLENRCRRP